MRRLIPILLLLAVPSFGAIAFDATAGHHGNVTATTGNLQVTVTIPSGNTVLVAIGVNNSVARTVSTVCDGTGTNQCTGGNTYTQLSTLDTNCSHACQIFLWGSCRVANSATAVTVVISGTYANGYVDVISYTGVGTNCFGNTATGTSASAATMTASATMQDTNNFFVLAGNQKTSTQPTFSSGTGSTLRDSITGTVGGIGVGDATSASTGSLTANINSNKTAGYNAAGVELRSSNASAGSTRHRAMVINR